MKKMLFFLFIMFVFNLNVRAVTIYPNMSSSNSMISEVFTSDDVINNTTGSADFIFHIAYYDRNSDLLEAFTVYDDADFHNVNVGYDCKKIYDNFGDFNSSEMCQLDKYLMYSSGKDLSYVKYWKLTAINKNTDITSFCENETKVTNSSICQNVIGGSSLLNYYNLLIFEEYSPVSFSLDCNPKEVKKGETSDCDLVINALEEVTKITIPVSSDLYDVEHFNEADGWELIDNEDGTVTIISENGFSGEGVVLGATLKFKEDLTDDVEIVLEDINYTTSDGFQLSGSAKDSVTIYEEPVVEEPKVEEESEDNPNTIDNVSLVSIAFLLTMFIVLVIYRFKKI